MSDTAMDALVGRRGELVVTVADEHSADRYGNAGMHVLATPALLALFEQASMLALDPTLAAGRRSVGSGVDFSHVAPTPLGDEVVVTAEIEAVDGLQVDFRLEARDSREQIARGRHTRVVVDADRFRRRLERKAPA